MGTPRALLLGAIDWKRLSGHLAVALLIGGAFTPVGWAFAVSYEALLDKKVDRRKIAEETGLAAGCLAIIAVLLKLSLERW